MLALLFGTFCFLVIFTSELNPFKTFRIFLCCSFFLASHLFWSFSSVILQRCFCWGILFTSRGRLRELHWINCIAAFQSVVFFTFYLLLFHMNLRSPSRRYSLTFLGSSCSSSVPLAMKAHFAFCVSSQYIEGRSSWVSYKQLIPGKSNIQFSPTFPEQKVWRKTQLVNNYQIMATWKLLTTTFK